jgi:hypothetical protein
VIRRFSSTEGNFDQAAEFLSPVILSEGKPSRSEGFPQSKDLYLVSRRVRMEPVFHLGTA